MITIIKFMKMNRRLLLFEHKKSILNKTYLILFISLFVSMTLFVSYNYIQNQSYISEMKEQYKNHMEFSKNKFQSIDFLIENSKNEIEKQLYKEEKSYWQEAQVIFNTLYLDYKNEVIKEKEHIEHLLQWNKHLLIGLEKNYALAAINKLEISEVKTEITKYKYLLEKDISLLSSPYECTSINLLYQLLDSKFILIFSILLMMFISDVYGTDFDKGTHKVMYTSPYSRKEISLNKLAYSVFLSLLFIFFLFLFFICFGFVFGFGEMNYPFIINNVYHPVISIAIKGIILYMLMNLFICSFLHLLTYYFLSHNISLIITVFTYAIVLILSISMNSNKMITLLPFSHTLLLETITNNTFLPICINTIIWTFIFIVLSIKYFEKKDL